MDQNPAGLIFLGEVVFVVNLVVHLFKTKQLMLIQKMGAVAGFPHTSM